MNRSDREGKQAREYPPVLRVHVSAAEIVERDGRFVVYAVDVTEIRRDVVAQAARAARASITGAPSRSSTSIEAEARLAAAEPAFVVSRRYRQFEALHTLIKAIAPPSPASPAPLPILPPAAALRSFAPEYIENMRIGLSSYLGELAEMAFGSVNVGMIMGTAMDEASDERRRDRATAIARALALFLLDGATAADAPPGAMVAAAVRAVRTQRQRQSDVGHLSQARQRSLDRREQRERELLCAFAHRALSPASAPPNPWRIAPRGLGHTPLAGARIAGGSERTGTHFIAGGAAVEFHLRVPAPPLAPPHLVCWRFESDPPTLRFEARLEGGLSGSLALQRPRRFDTSSEPAAAALAVPYAKLLNAGGAEVASSANAMVLSSSADTSSAIDTEVKEITCVLRFDNSSSALRGRTLRLRAAVVPLSDAAAAGAADALASRDNQETGAHDQYNNTNANASTNTNTNAEHTRDQHASQPMHQKRRKEQETGGQLQARPRAHSELALEESLKREALASVVQRRALRAARHRQRARRRRRELLRDLQSSPPLPIGALSAMSYGYAKRGGAIRGEDTSTAGYGSDGGGIDDGVDAGGGAGSDSDNGNHSSSFVSASSCGERDGGTSSDAPSSTSSCGVRSQRAGRRHARGRLSRLCGRGRRVHNRGEARRTWQRWRFSSLSGRVAVAGAGGSDSELLPSRSAHMNPSAWCGVLSVRDAAVLLRWHAHDETDAEVTVGRRVLSQQALGFSGGAGSKAMEFEAGAAAEEEAVEQETEELLDCAIAAALLASRHEYGGGTSSDSDSFGGGEDSITARYKNGESTIPGRQPTDTSWGVGRGAHRGVTPPRIPSGRGAAGRVMRLAAIKAALQVQRKSRVLLRPRALRQQQHGRVRRQGELGWARQQLVAASQLLHGGVIGIGASGGTALSARSNTAGIVGSSDAASATRAIGGGVGSSFSRTAGASRSSDITTYADSGTAVAELFRAEYARHSASFATPAHSPQNAPLPSPSLPFSPAPAKGTSQTTISHFDLTSGNSGVSGGSSSDSETPWSLQHRSRQRRRGGGGEAAVFEAAQALRRELAQSNDAEDNVNAGTHEEGVFVCDGGLQEQQSVVQAPSRLLLAHAALQREVKVSRPRSVDNKSSRKKSTLVPAPNQRPVSFGGRAACDSDVSADVGVHSDSAALRRSKSKQSAPRAHGGAASDAESTGSAAVFAVAQSIPASTSVTATVTGQRPQHHHRHHGGASQRRRRTNSSRQRLRALLRWRWRWGRSTGTDDINLAHPNDPSTAGAASGEGIVRLQTNDAVVDATARAVSAAEDAAAAAAELDRRPHHLRLQVSAAQATARAAEARAHLQQQRVAEIVRAAKSVRAQQRDVDKAYGYLRLEARKRGAELHELQLQLATEEQRADEAEAEAAREQAALETAGTEMLLAAADKAARERREAEDAARRAAVRRREAEDAQRKLAAELEAALEQKRILTELLHSYKPAPKSS